MSSLAVVLDACVLYPMYLRDTLLRAAEAGLYRAHWSADILDEVIRNVVADKHVTRKAAERLIAMMRASFPEAEVTGHQLLIGSMLNDPKDRHVTAAAVRCGAQVIVTDNIKDFPIGALVPFDLEAQTADTFLTHLCFLDPEIMADIITAQAADYDAPPMTALQLLDRLAKHAPRFVDLVRTHFSG